MGPCALHVTANPVQLRSALFLDSPAVLGAASWSAVVMALISDQGVVTIAVAVNVRACVFRLVGRRSVLWGDQNLRRTVWPRHSGLLLVASNPLHLKTCSGQVGDHRSRACNQLIAVTRYGKIAQSLSVLALSGISSIFPLKICCISLQVCANASAIDSDLLSKIDLERMLS